MAVNGLVAERPAQELEEAASQSSYHSHVSRSGLMADLVADPVAFVAIGLALLTTCVWVGILMSAPGDGWRIFSAFAAAMPSLAAPLAWLHDRRETSGPNLVNCLLISTLAQLFVSAAAGFAALYQGL